MNSHQTDKRFETFSVISNIHSNIVAYFEVSQANNIYHYPVQKTLTLLDLPL